MMTMWMVNVDDPQKFIDGAHFFYLFLHFRLDGGALFQLVLCCCYRNQICVQVKCEMWIACKSHVFYRKSRERGTERELERQRVYNIIIFFSGGYSSNHSKCDQIQQEYYQNFLTPKKNREKK